MRAIIYTRVSTEQQASSGLGLEAQSAACLALCAREQLEVVSTLTDDGVSGTAPLTARPALLQALAAIQQGEADVLIVAKLDRVSRDLLIQLTIERELSRAGARLMSAAGEGTATDSPADRLVRNILSAVAENEAAVISARTKAALQAKRARGEKLGRAPLGMKRNEAGTAFEPAEDFYLVAQLLWLRFRKKQSYQAIATTMSQISNRRFSYPTIYRAVQRHGKQPSLYKGAKTLDQLAQRDFSGCYTLA